MRSPRLRALELSTAPFLAVASDAAQDAAPAATDLASDLFSLDNGAVISLEYRYGITDRIQAGVHRSIFNKEIVTFSTTPGQIARGGDKHNVFMGFNRSRKF